MNANPPFVDLDDLVARIEAGSTLAVPPDYSGVAMAATRALLRRGTDRLHLVACPTSGLQADLLIGAGRLASLEAAAVSLGEFGPAPRFTAAVGDGAINLRDSTCPAIHAGLQAAEKGVPFLPLRGIIGSDLLGKRSDWRIIDNPFETGDPIVALPAITPDFALFHAPLGDREGNVWIGRRRELVTMAHAARTTLVTVEARYDGNLLADERMAAGTLPSLYVGALADAPQGAWPLALADHYPVDARHMREYARLARSDEGFGQYLARHLRSRAAA
ncbi:MAG: CoA transferase subunit A [Alphaproteobacteria bacterium]